mmetsp:Transcript_19294/g.34938  ORF Transcript_19294/g.34938 Transcript_19294/m.34938 type:complete len:208 (-) Transcript_19294:851-1474(-)
MHFKRADRMVSKLTDVLIIEIVEEAICSKNEEISTLYLDDIPLCIPRLVLLRLRATLHGANQSFLAFPQQLREVFLDGQARQLEWAIERMLLLLRTSNWAVVCTLLSDLLSPQMQQCCITQACHSHSAVVVAPKPCNKCCSRSKGSSALVAVSKHLDCSGPHLPSHGRFHFPCCLSAALHQFISKCSGTALEAPLPLPDAICDTHGA